jgi:PhnB protein
MTKVDAVPQGYHTITPSLAITGADKAIHFYKEAFGAGRESGCRAPTAI